MEKLFKALLWLLLGIAIFILVKVIMHCSEEHIYVIKTPTNEYTVDEYYRIQGSSCISFHVNGEYKLVSGNFEITQIK